MAEYDPAIIQAHADGLYARATWLHLASTIGGVLAGLGYLYGWASASARTENTTWFVALALGGGTGWLVGSGAAFAMRLRAQLALCQLQIEINTRPPVAEDDP